jgi:hypothetical protein
MSICDHLQLLIGVGLTPAPLKLQSKEAPVRWSDGWNSTVQQIERRLAKPKVNTSVPCRENLVIVGCRSKKTLCNLAATHDPLSGCTVIKSGRSYHTWGKPIKPIGAQRINSVEIKCLGSQVLAPPPTHPTSVAYVFQVATGTVRDCPRSPRWGR